MGMMPKNKQRERIVKRNLIMIHGQYHNYDNIGLPQFTDPVPEDINEKIGITDLYAPDATETHEIVYMDTMGQPIAEELKDFPLNIDESLGQPFYTRKKDFVYNRDMIK